MLPIDFKGKKVLVLGLGLHGGSLWLIKWLCQHGAEVTVSDLKTAKHLSASLKALKKYSVKYVLGSHPVSLLSGCEMVFQNPAVPREAEIIKLARQRRIPVENEASLFFRLSPSQKIIAITGSKGKSTTTAILGRVVKSCLKNSMVAGNIKDTVLFDAIRKINKETALVLELSSWQLELMGEHRIAPPYAVITNILPDHLNRYKSMNDYAQAKANIFKWQKKSDYLIANLDNPIVKKIIKTAKGQIYWFSKTHIVSRGCYVKKGLIWWCDKKTTQPILKIKHLKLLGEHNLENVLAAITAAMVYGLPEKKVIKAVVSFKGLHDRLELVKELKGVKYVNDTTATAPVAALAALKVWPKNKAIIIVGGQDKSLPYNDLIKGLRNWSSHIIILPGSASDKIIKGLSGVKKMSLVKSMAEAVKLAHKIAKSGQIVLLSPGAASFNLFKHEFDRGQKFIQAVKKLK